MRPKRVVLADPNRIVIKHPLGEPTDDLLQLGFFRDYELSEPDQTLRYIPNSESKVCHMLEKLRDMKIPISSHRHGGNERFIELWKSEGLLKGKFLLLNFFGNDFDEDAPYRIEEF